MSEYDLENSNFHCRCLTWEITVVWDLLVVYLYNYSLIIMCMIRIVEDWWLFQIGKYFNHKGKFSISWSHEYSLVSMRFQFLGSFFSFFFFKPIKKKEYRRKSWHVLWALMALSILNQQKDLSTYFSWNFAVWQKLAHGMELSNTWLTYIQYCPCSCKFWVYYIFKIRIW